jgi:tRNA G18 (ribose-2'-O)-methylase SpoU
LSLVKNQKLISIDQMIAAASKLANYAQSTQLTSDTWANALTQAARLYHEIAKQVDDHDTDLQSFACLLQMKQCLPVIDTSLTDAHNFGTVSRFLSEEFDHIDFQATDNGSVL